MKGKRLTLYWEITVLQILKVEKKYEELVAGLQDIINDAKNCVAIQVDDKQYNIEFYLGGSWQLSVESRLQMQNMLVCGANVL